MSDCRYVSELAETKYIDEDMVAALAMIALLINTPHTPRQVLARQAYDVAEAMARQREINEQKNRGDDNADQHQE